ncbi:MAG: hypothetical protein IPM98_14380 [Lewinellaceae bacterium]|nr:hypothetical protein [Lewinellaceae bacterium]
MCIPLKTAYAQYTIAFSFLAVFVNISNVGITPAMTGIGGRVWQDPVALRALLNSAFQLRTRIGLWLLAPFTAYCVWQFGKTGAGWFAAAFLALLVLAAAWVQIQAALYAIVLQLNKAVRALQQNELAATALKLAGIAPILFSGPVYWLVGWVGLASAFNLVTNQTPGAAVHRPTRGNQPRLSPGRSRISPGPMPCARSIGRSKGRSAYCFAHCLPLPNP